MPDHFDRLVAKGARGRGRDRAGSGSDAGSEAVVRVRPRLPGPFERIDGLGPVRPDVDGESAAPGRPDVRPAAAPLPWPTAASRPGPAEGAPRTAAHDGRPAATPVLPLPRTPLLVAPSIAPVAAPTVEPVVRAGAARPAAPPAGTATPGTAPSRTDIPRAAGAPPVPVRPAVAPASGRRAALAATLGHAPGSGDRGRQRPVERVVRVQIGRVEVRAAERTPVGPRRPAAARPAPALDLDRYLNREPS
ncbi:hypothetical protein ACGF0D_01165 [Kitasatospora sp. NPDC048298]|uniref:hypothetical protein n=1 Tax=Kitasatospora sp. NPDC048298 TaxID=3364049 RepID=UPI00371ED121